MSRLASNVARALALLCCACSALAWAPRPALADDVVNVVGGTTSPSLFDVEDMVADKGGFFAAEHLSVNKQFSGSASVCFQLIATGKGDICTSSVEPVILGYAKGLRAVFFLNRDPRYDYVTAVLTTSPIKTLEDFKGANIGESNVGSTSEITTNSVLSGAGLKKSDYSYTPVGIGALALTSIQTHKVDAMSMPTLELAVEQMVGGVKYRYFPDTRLSDVPNVGFAATPATIAAKGDILKRYARAIVKASILIRVNPKLAARYFMEGSGQRVTDDALALMAREVEALQPDFPAYDLTNTRIGYFSPRGMELYCKFIAAAGLTPSIVPGTELVTNQFVAFANDFDKKAFIAQAKAMH
jgi:NitT/TauT family transport system substrate-binding protein